MDVCGCFLACVFLEDFEKLLGISPAADRGLLQKRAPLAALMLKRWPEISTESPAMCRQFLSSWWQKCFQQFAEGP